MTGLAPGATLEGRYRIDLVSSAGAGQQYIGSVLRTGAPIKVLELPPLVLRALGRAQHVEHSNLCTVIETIPRTGGHGLAVVEHLPGRTLEERISTEGRLPIDASVAIAFALADALACLHHRGAAHGLVTPASVIIQPQGRVGVVLGYAPFSPPPNPYHSPERGIGPPSPADDVWGLAALLHQMLVGEPPPADGYRSRHEVAAAGVDRDELATLLANCLARRPENRVSMAHAVRDLLVHALPATATVPSQTAPHSAPASSRPPPSGPPSWAPPPSVPPSSASSPPDPPRPASVPLASDPTPAVESTRPVQMQQANGLQSLSTPRSSGPTLVWIAGATVLAMVVAVLVILGIDHLRASPAGPVASTAPASATSTPTREPDPPAPAPSEIQPQRELTGEDLANCVMKQLPPNSFKATPNFDWLCSATDPRQGHSRLRSALVLGAKGGVTKAMSLWSRLRWYGMASFTVIRATCCAHPPSLELPATASCGRTAEILNELNDAVVAEKDLGPILDRYTRNVRCHSNQGRDRFFGVDSELGGGQRTAFDEFFEQRRK